MIKKGAFQEPPHNRICSSVYVSYIAITRDYFGPIEEAGSDLAVPKIEIPQTAGIKTAQKCLRGYGGWKIGQINL